MQAELSDAHIEIESLKTELAKAHLYTKAGNHQSSMFFSTVDFCLILDW